MSKVWKTFRLCDCSSKRSNILTATPSKREASCYLHGMFSEEKVVNGSNWLIRVHRKRFYDAMLTLAIG
jgi:hypothetical protein